MSIGTLCHVSLDSWKQDKIIKNEIILRGQRLAGRLASQHAYRLPTGPPASLPPFCAAHMVLRAMISGFALRCSLAPQSLNLRHEARHAGVQHVGGSDHHARTRQTPNTTKADIKNIKHKANRVPRSCVRRFL